MASVRYSWASDNGERDSWISFVRGMEGMVLSQVRYFDIDYRRDEVSPNHSGPRNIEVDSEWAEPSWRFPGGHTVDYGVELMDRSGQAWSVTWIPPGRMEGLALDNGSMFAGALDPEAAVAIWEVSARSDWEPLIGEQVQAIRVGYEAWDNSGKWWCPRLDLDFPSASVEFLEAQGAEDGSIQPSADNIVVRFHRGS